MARLLLAVTPDAHKCMLPWCLQAGVCEFELQSRWEAAVGSGWGPRLELAAVGMGEKQVGQQRSQHQPAGQPSSAGEPSSLLTCCTRSMQHIAPASCIRTTLLAGPATVYGGGSELQCSPRHNANNSSTAHSVLRACHWCAGCTAAIQASQLP